MLDSSIKEKEQSMYNIDSVNRDAREPRWANNPVNDNMSDVYTQRLELPRQTL